MRKTIAWVLYRLEDLGGGERLLLEGAKYYRSKGYRVIIITWAFDRRALFGDLYEDIDIVVMGVKNIPRNKIIRVAWSRAKSLIKFRQILRKNNVSLIFCQGEYDVALVYLATLRSKIRYRFLIFGQMFQYPHDLSKYSLVFRRHLHEIVASCEGYRETIPERPPKLSLLDRLANEAISVVRFFAVRKADKTFSFSRQVQWETQKLFGVIPTIAKGAFPAELCGRSDFQAAPYSAYSLPQGEYILSLSRLDKKKRIDVIIHAFGLMQPSEYHLVIGGTGEHEERLREEVNKLGLAQKVSFIGRVEEKHLLTIKHHCALFVSMDIGDFDISPLEALAVGAPIVCPTEFEMDEQLERCDAISICRAKGVDVAEAMRKILSDGFRPNRAELVNYSWEHYFDCLVS